MSKDITYTAKLSVSCGGGDPLDHPLIYLEIDKDKRQKACPYCGKLFKLTE